MNPPGLDQLERAQGLAEKGPLTLALGLFVLLFVSLFFWNAWEARRNARDLLQVTIAYQTAISALTVKIDELVSVMAPRRRAAARRTDPEAETGRYQALPKGGQGDASSADKPQGEGVGTGQQGAG